MSAEFLPFRDEGSWIGAWLDRFFTALDAALRRGSRSFHAALCGGSTPEPLYRALAKALCERVISDKIEIHFWVGDEREVPAQDPRRNGKMIEKALAPAFERGCLNLPLRLHLWPDLPREEAIPLFEKEIRHWLGPEPEFDLVLLGVGEDGHTAGLFDARDAGIPGPLVLATTAPAEPRRRMTLGAGLLGGAVTIIIAAAGARKLPVLSPLADSSPISLVAGENPVILFLDANR